MELGGRLRYGFGKSSLNLGVDPDEAADPGNFFFHFH